MNFRSVVTDYIIPLLCGILAGVMVLTAITHPSTCKYEEVC